MGRRTASIALAGLLLVGARPAAAADPPGPAPVGRFRATCEDLARFCVAGACGRDQIEAAQGCQTVCPGSVVLSVMPAACPLAVRPPGPVLRRLG